MAAKKTRSKAIHSDQGSARYSVHVDMGKHVHSENPRKRNGVVLSEGRDRNVELTDVLYAKGAYGRKPTVKDWEDGKDFEAVNPPIWKGTHYFSIGEAEFIYSLGYKRIVFGGNEGFDVELVMK